MQGPAKGGSMTSGGSPFLHASSVADQALKFMPAATSCINQSVSSRPYHYKGLVKLQKV